METAHFPALCIEVNIAEMQMLCFNLYQFTDPGSGTCQKPNNKIPQQISVVLKHFLKCLIIFLGNDIIQKGCLLGTDDGQPEVNHLAAAKLFKAVQVPVDSVYSIVYRGCFVVINKIILKANQMIDSQVIIQGIIKPAGCHAAADRIGRSLGFFQVGMKGRFIYFLHICIHAERTFHSITSQQSDSQ